MMIDMNNRVIYKRVKINWWIILILVIMLAGIYANMTFAYIHQWGNSPVDEAGLIILAIMWIGVSVLIFAGRFTLTIDDKFLVVKFGSYGWNIKIHVTQIKDVSIEKMSFWTFLKTLSRYGRLHPFDFTGQTVKILTKGGTVYKIAIKNAQKIKEEIEKRMLTTNEP